MSFSYSFFLDEEDSNFHICTLEHANGDYELSTARQWEQQKPLFKQKKYFTVGEKNLFIVSLTL